MTPRNVFLILAALVTAGGTVYFVQNWLTSERAAIEAMRNKPATPKKKEVFVLVARRNLPAGLFVKAEHLRWQAWPDKSMPATYVRKGQAKISDFEGSVVRRGIGVGEPITEGRLVKPGDRGFLAAVLDPGMRAISVPVNAATGIAGLVFPGDRVDLLLTTQTRVQSGGVASIRRASETVLTGVRVLAVDQKTDDQSGKPKVAKTATLEVTPKQAEIVAVAAELGKLSLSLRSLARTDQRADGRGARMVLASTGSNGTDGGTARPRRGRGYTRDSEASRLIYASRAPRPGRRHRVNVLRGSESQQLSFSARQAAASARNYLRSTSRGLRSLQP